MTDTEHDFKYTHIDIPFKSAPDIETMIEQANEVMKPVYQRLGAAIAHYERQHTTLHDGKDKE